MNCIRTDILILTKYISAATTAYSVTRATTRSLYTISKTPIADGRLVPVALRRVDVAVPGLERGDDRALALGAFDELPHAEPQEWDADVRGDRDLAVCSRGGNGRWR